MYFVKDIEEQNKVLSKIKDIYLYNEICIQQMPLHKKFKYVTFFDEYNYVGNCYFYYYLSKVCQNTKDEYIYLCKPEKIDIEVFKKKYKVFPTIYMENKDLKNDEIISSIIDDHGIFDFLTVNTFVIPSSFKWLVFVNRDYELGYFVSNDKNLNILFKTEMKEYEVEYPVLAIDDLLKFPYYYAKTKEEFNTLAISKLEIV